MRTKHEVYKRQYNANIKNLRTQYNRSDFELVALGLEEATKFINDSDDELSALVAIKEWKNKE